MARRLALMAALALGVLPVAASQSPGSKGAVEPKLTMTAIMEVLKNSGYQPEAVNSPPPPPLVGQIIANVAKIKVVIGLFQCGAPNTDAICGLTFSSLFTDTAGLSQDTLIAMNDASMLRVLAPLGADGRPTGFITTYAYPCEGFHDAQFVPMVLRAFRQGVGFVTASYLKLRPPAAADNAAAGTSGITSNSALNGASSITPEPTPGGASVDLPTSP
jgi:hypothetical protein